MDAPSTEGSVASSASVATALARHRDNIPLLYRDLPDVPLRHVGPVQAVQPSSSVHGKQTDADTQLYAMVLVDTVAVVTVAASSMDVRQAFTVARTLGQGLDALVQEQSVRSVLTLTFTQLRGLDYTGLNVYLTYTATAAAAMEGSGAVTTLWRHRGTQQRNHVSKRQRLARHLHLHRHQEGKVRESQAGSRRPSQGSNQDSADQITQTTANRNETLTAIINFNDEKAAEKFVMSLETALTQLSHALTFLCNDYPLEDDVKLQLILHQEAVFDGPRPISAANTGLIPSTRRQALQKALSSRPEFGTSVDLPAAWDECVQAGSEDLRVLVMISCPLGPMVAVLTPSLLQHKSQGQDTAAGAIFSVVAQPLDELAQAMGNTRLRRTTAHASPESDVRHYVRVHFKATCKPPAESPDVHLAHPTHVPHSLPPATDKAGKQQGKAGAAHASSRPHGFTHSVLKAALELKAPVGLLLCFAVALWLVMGADKGTGYQVLQAVAVVLLPLVLLQGSRAANGAYAQQDPGTGTISKWTKQRQNGIEGSSVWALELLSAEIICLVFESLLDPAPSQEPEVALQQTYALQLSVAMQAHPPDLQKQFEALAKKDPAYVTADEIHRYTIGRNDNLAAAYASLSATVQWRQQHKIGTITQRPCPVHAIFQRHGCACAFPGRDADQRPAVFIPLGRMMNTFDATTKEGVTNEDRVYYFVYCQEWLYRIIDPRPLPYSRAIMIFDMKGFNIAHLSNHYLAHMKEFGLLLGLHYLERLQAAVIINAPGWINMAWKLAASMMGEATKARVQVTGGGPAAAKALGNVLCLNELPTCLGGNSTVQLGDSEWDKRISAAALG